MSIAALKGNANGTGTVTIETPNTNSDFTISLPAGTGTAVVNGVNSAIVSGTSVASTSGTSIDFTNIPSWVKRITVMFNGVSTNGSSLLLVQLGNGSIVSTGYNGYYFLNATYRGSFSTGFILRGLSASTSVNYGSIVLTNFSGNTWLETSIVADSGYSLDTTQSGGSLALSSTLDRVRITTVNGTDTFDAGTINIFYE